MSVKVQTTFKLEDFPFDLALEVLSEQEKHIYVEEKSRKQQQSSAGTSADEVQVLVRCNCSVYTPCPQISYATPRRVPFVANHNICASIANTHTRLCVFCQRSLNGFQNSPKVLVR